MFRRKGNINEKPSNPRPSTPPPVQKTHCVLIESKRRTTFRDAVNRLLLEDKHAQLHEVINMLVSDRKRLEQRLGAINKELARREQELYEVDKELIEKWTSS